MTEDGQCPHCRSQNEYPIHFRISSVTNRILSDIVLDQTQDAKDPTSKPYIKEENTLHR
jgi:hypothetical protein